MEVFATSTGTKRARLTDDARQQWREQKALEQQNEEIQPAQPPQKILWDATLKQQLHNTLTPLIQDTTHSPQHPIPIQNDTHPTPQMNTAREPAPVKQSKHNRHKKQKQQAHEPPIPLPIVYPFPTHPYPTTTDRPPA